MILTNRLGLPRSIANAVRNDPYSRGEAHISVTGLIGPARKRALELQHRDEISEDVAERVWSLYGQIIHGILQRSDDQAWCEERLYIDRHGWRISGSFDRYVLEATLLQDYKFTSTWSVKDGVKPEWECQENLYALMLREHGYRVDKLEIVAVLRDWQKSKAKHTPDYPQVPAVILPVTMWPADQTEAYIHARLLAHGQAQTTLPECSSEERWERPAVYALRKVGNKRAIKLFDNEAEAQAAVEAGGKSFVLEVRPAEQPRCQDYCAALPFCAQGQSLLKQAEDFREAQRFVVTRSPIPATAEV